MRSAAAAGGVCVAAAAVPVPWAQPAADKSAAVEAARAPVRPPVVDVPRGAVRSAAVVDDAAAVAAVERSVDEVRACAAAAGGIAPGFPAARPHAAHNIGLDHVEHADGGVLRLRVCGRVRVALPARPARIDAVG